MTASTYLTPPAYAEHISVDPSKVIGWIRSGELWAINVATSQTGRPQFRIPLDAILEFEHRRSATAPPKPARRRRKQAADFHEYF